MGAKRGDKRIGYLTPDVAPEERLCRSFAIPNSPQWLGVFMGALMPLIDASNWTKSGELSTEEAASAFRNIIFGGYDEDGECAEYLCGVRYRDGEFQTYNPYTGEWYENPNCDPRVDIRYLLPPRAGADARCNAAANVRARFEEWLQNYFTAVSILEAVTSIGDFIGTFTSGAALLVSIIADAVGALIDIGNALIILEMTDDAWDEFQCIVYSEIADDGQVSKAAKDRIYTRVQAQMTAVQFGVISLIMNTLGEVGMSNAGATGEDVGDCSDCPIYWCRRTVFSAGETDAWTGFAQPVAPTREANGTWLGAQTSGGTYLNIERTFAVPTHIQSISFKLGFDVSYPFIGSGTWISAVIDGVETDLTGYLYPPAGISSISVTGDWQNVTRIRLNSQINALLTERCYEVTVNGMDDNPFGESNCEE